MYRIRQLFLPAVVMCAVSNVLPSVAQNMAQGMPPGGVPGSPPNQQVAMIMLQVSHEKGHTFITSPKGYRAEVPGKGISSNAKAVAIYQDPQQNFWYIDKHGTPTEVKPEVVRSAMMQIQGEIQQNHMMGQAMQQGVPPMGAGMSGAGGVPVQQTTVVQQPSSGGGGGAGAMMGAASMAMSGTALGMSIGAMANSGHNNYYGVPYGRPMYQENHRYYYNNDSKKVYVDQNEKNKACFDQWNKQGDWAHRQDWAHAQDARNYGGGRRFRR